MDAGNDQLHEQYLIINNVQKPKNIRNMLLSAGAFGVVEVLVIGQRTSFESVIADPMLTSLLEAMTITKLPNLTQCREYLKVRDVTIVGIEILYDAKSINDDPFHGSMAFIMGNEGSGLSEAQVAICDEFMYIPQYGGGTASLNVTVAASIIMQTFALWAQYPKTPIVGSHFVHVKTDVSY